ncbi:MAG: PAS domain-containing protein [Gemmatimonadaceae bacterium]
MSAALQWILLGAVLLMGAAYVLARKQVAQRRAVGATLAEQNRRLLEQRERLDFALVAAGLGQWDLNLADHTAHRTLLHDQIFGYESLLPEWTYERFLEHVVPEHRGEVDASFRAAISAGSVWSFECRIRRPDGEIRWITAKARMQTDASGRVERMLGVVGDVTDRKRNDERFQDVRRRLDATLEGGQVSTWVWDLVEDRVYSDRNVSAFFNLPPDDGRGIPGADFRDTIHPEDRPRVHEGAERAITSGSDFISEYRVVSFDPPKWAYSRARMEYEDGVPVRLSGVVMDITERKRAEEGEREARSRLESLLSAGEIGTWEFDVPSGRVQGDGNLARMFGISETEAHSSTMDTYLRAIHPGDRPRVESRIMHAIESGDTFEAEYRIIDPAGATRWVVGRGRVERDSAGRAVRLPSVVVDMTARRQAEERERLLLSEAASANTKFRAFFDQGVNLAGIIEVDGTIVETNRLAWEGCGFTREQIVGRKFWEGPWWTPSKQVVKQVRAACARAAEGETFRAEIPYFVADGSERMLDIMIVPILNEAGRVAFLAPTGTDITVRKLAESDRQRFVSLAENSTDFIGMCDAEFVPTYLNRAGLQMIGLDDVAEARRISLDELFFPEDRERIRKEFLPVVLSRGDGDIEVRFRHFKTGDALWMLFKVFALPDADGEPAGLATVSRDITDRKQLENELRKLATDLGEADRRKDEFLATLAHELRNPLAPIRNGLQIMRLATERGESAAPTVDSARLMMERQLKQLVHLVDDLLDVSRISHGKLELRSERVDLGTLLRGAAESSRTVIEAADHELVLGVPPDPVYVDADVTRLEQVFANLLNNASKYSEPGGRIGLSAERDGDQVVVRVTDTGVGIPAEMVPRVFDLFTQVDPSLERSKGGLGIGLTLVRRLVELHGGQVEARSDGLGRGSEFIVRLPVVSPTLPAAAASSNSSSAAVQRRILVADDNVDAAVSLATLLTLMGHEVRTVHDGLQAVEEALLFQPDVVLLDIGMPKLNGYQACLRIREQPWAGRAVVVALTGWSQDTDKRRSQQAGFDHHLVKPVDLEVLEQLLVPHGTTRSGGG